MNENYVSIEFDSKTQKYCKYCGKVIDIDCVVCPKCGKQVEELKQQGQQPIIFNNANSTSSSANSVVRGRYHYGLLGDLIMIIFTSGLWIIWMLIRPKYY